MVFDIFDVDLFTSVVRERLRERGNVDLHTVSVPTFRVTDDFTVKKAKISAKDRKEARSVIDEFINPLVAEASAAGYGTNFHAGLYEAVLNAFQHGNKRDPEKEVVLAYNISPSSLTIAVMDEGGVIDEEFMGYVLRFRQGKHKGSVVSFYEFSHKEKPKDNLGTGTYFMHAYFDKVEYHKSEKGGLVALLVKEKSNIHNTTGII